MLRRLALVFAVVVLVALAVFAFGGEMERGLVAAVIDAATGYRVAFDAISIGSGRLELDRVAVENVVGEPVLEAERAVVLYRARDLLPGSERRYGLVAVDVERPRLHLIRHADGSFNLPIGGSASGASAGGGAGTPLRLAITVRDGTIDLSDPNRAIALSRELSIGNIAFTAAVDTAARSAYRVSGNVGGFREQGFTVRGSLDAKGYAVHRLQARAIAIAPLVDYVINSQSAQVDKGVARDVDVRAYAFGDAGGLGPYHLVGGARLDDGELRIPGLIVPATAMQGRIDLFDDGLATPKMTARLGEVLVRVVGGLYRWSSPAFRLGVVADAPLHSVRELFAFSQHLPLDGAAHIETLLESSVGSPLVATTLRARKAMYGAFPVEAADGRAIYDESALDVVGARASYGPLAVGAEGAIDLGDIARTQLVVDARGPSGGVPYAAQVAPGAQLHATALLAGVGVRFDARGEADGASSDESLAGVFHVDPYGEGAFGPVLIARSSGASAAGAFYLNRRENESAFWGEARGMPFARVPGDPHLPGLALAPPVFGGVLDGSIAGDGPPSNFRIAGLVHARAFETGGVAIDEVAGNLAGTFSNLHLQAVWARGPWGSFRGNGAYVGRTLALAGSYHGTFSKLRIFTGDVAAQGSLDGPVSLLISPQRTIVQARNDRSAGGTVQGVPVDRLSGTVAIVNKQLRVYAATALVAGGAFAAAGYADDRRGVGVSVSGADARRLRKIAPLGEGRIAAIGRLRSRGSQTRFEGGLSVGEATFDRLPLGGNGDVTLAGPHLEVRSTDGLLGSALGSIAGSLEHLGAREPHYDLRVHLTTARIAPFAQAMYPDRHDIAGTLEGDVVVRGTPATLSVAGSLGIPEGTVNGLAFDGGRFDVAIDPAGLEVRNGNVTFGSTNVNFGARFAGNDASMRVVSHGANLADFNDYFDAGDTLGGTGNIDVRFRKHRTEVRTSADLAIAKLNYRRFDLGDAAANWTSRGPDVRGSVAFGGASGRLATSGTLSLATRAPLDKLLERSSFTGNAKLRGLDLGVWLPALGFQEPIGGRVDADARIAGPLRNPDVTTTLSLSDGILGKFPVDRLEIAASSTLRRTTITRAVLDLPSVEMTGSGTFGLAERDPIALSVHGKSANVGAVAARLLGEKLPLQGALEADVKIQGTRAHPRIVGGFDLEGATLHGVSIPQALGEVSVSGRDIVLSDAEIAFAKGTLYLAGSVPLEIDPFGFGPASAPITLDLSAKAIDLANFAPLLPSSSTLQGTLNGHAAIGGTAGNPQLDGSVALTGGEFHAPFEITPLTNIGARVAFSGRSATLGAFHADAGGGTLDANGAIVFANLVRPSTDADYLLQATAKNFSLGVPAFVNGRVDGTLSLSHRPQQSPKLAGKLALNDAVIPFSALLLADTGSGSGFNASSVTTPTLAEPVLPPSDITFALDLTADHNVRVRSANVDIGARGTVHVAGTRDDPKLSGAFTSTGGTLTYFNTVFRVLDGKVTFIPDLGVIPNLDARAITHVLDPDPNTVRNVTGSADVTLDLHGPVTNLTIGLSSDPNYDRQQILGLLLSAPALGATTLFSNKDQATLYGTTTPAVPQTTIAGSRATLAESTVAQQAFGIANAQFTRTLLSPIETSVAGAIGLTNINVNVDYTGNVGLTARKVLGSKLNAIYGTSFGYPYRQTFGFEFKPSTSTAAQVTVFQTLGAYGVDSLTPTTYLSSENGKLEATQPSQGTAGFSISIQHLF